MDVLSLAIALLALLAAAGSWWASRRQADAAERAAEEAERATEVAAEALMVAKQAHDLESTRLRAELTPRLKLTPADKGASQVQQYWLTNEGPVRYDELVIDYRPTRLLLGFQTGSMEDGDEDIVPDLRTGPIEVGEQVLVNLYRLSADDTGTVFLTVKASRPEATWEVVLPVELTRPPRLYSF